jgi:hypothetical protein
MNIEPVEAYVYQPLPPQPDGKFYGVGGLTIFGLTSDEARIQGVDKQTASEIARVCNDNPEFAKNFVIGIKSKLGL